MTNEMRYMFMVFACCLAVIPKSGTAQTAGQLTSRTFKPDSLQASEAIAIEAPESYEATPNGPQTLIRLAGMVLDGAPPTPATQVDSIRERLLAGPVSGADIVRAARALERSYSADGFVFVRVILPPQTLTDGATLRFEVVDGFIDQIDLEKVPVAVRARVEAVVASLKGRRGLTKVDIERRLLLAGQTPGLILRSTLAPGGAHGATTLVLEGSHRPLGGFARVDNTPSQAMGRLDFGFGIDANAIFGIGDLTYLRASGFAGDRFEAFFADRPRSRSLAAGVVVPLNDDGLSLNIEIANSRVTPENGFVQTQSEFERLSLRLRQALALTRAGTLDVEASIDIAREEQWLLPDGGGRDPLSLDRTRVARLSLDGSLIPSWGGVFTWRATASFGLPGLGARSAVDALPSLPLSREGADSVFQKVEATADYARSVAENLAIDLRARVQHAFGDPLLRSEQIGITSSSGLSTFDAGSMSGDAGWVLRGEISAPQVFMNGEVFSQLLPYAFAAVGAVYVARPTSLERSHTAGTSFGVGVRLMASGNQMDPSTTFAIEFGRQHRSDRAMSSHRITFTAATRF